MAAKVSPKTVRDIMTMRERGCTYEEIGRVLGLHWTAVGKIVTGKSQATCMRLIEVADAVAAYTENPTSENLNKLVGAGQSARQLIENS